jgi:hypothetical protein
VGEREKERKKREEERKKEEKERRRDFFSLALTLNPTFAMRDPTPFICLLFWTVGLYCT